MYTIINVLYFIIHKGHPLFKLNVTLLWVKHVVEHILYPFNSQLTTGSHLHLSDIVYL